MSDRLKEHINKYRDEFELYPLDLSEEWKKLSKQLKPSNSNHKLVYMSIAASVIIFILGGISIFNIQTNNRIYSTEMQEAQFYYQEIIDAKLILIKNQISDPQLVADLDELDQAFYELKNDLKDDAQNEEVIIAMIDNYRLKLKILEKILKNLDDERHEEDISL